MNWFKNSFGAAFGVFLAGSLFLLLFIIVGGTAFLYLRQKTIVQDEAAVQRAVDKNVDVIQGVVGAIQKNNRDEMRDLVISKFGLETGNDIHERLLYLEKIFREDSYYDIGQIIFAEVEKRESPDAKINIPSLLYDLTLRAGSQPTQRFVPFLATQSEVFALATQKIIKVDRTVRNPYEGEDTTPLNITPTYRENLDPETGLPIRKERSKTPGYVYAPQDPGRDPGYNGRRATAP